MLLKIHQSLNLKKKLTGLRKEGGRSALVADNAESVMKQLALARDWDPKKTGRRTRHGEARIKRSVKFDLIDGYRLFGIKQGHHFVFLYIGTHDECDRWISKNTGLRFVMQEDNLETMDPEDFACDDSLEEEDQEHPSDAASDDYLSVDLDERILRKIFSGLTHSK